MLKKVSEVAIPDHDPFLNDELHRKESAEILTKLIETITEPYVLAINSPWGTGKTTFIRMWYQKLNNEGYRSILFNAWENDFTDDPLLSLIGEFESFIKSQESEDKKNKFNKYTYNLKKYGGYFIRKVTPLALRLVTAGVLDNKDIANFISELAKEQITDYSIKKKSLWEFKKNLQNFVEELEKIKGYKQPIIFFIDELDRCRPTYAVELLENLKHLFSVTGIVFVLAIDMNQLVHQVKSLYGIGMNADGYLRRFIDLEYRLPDPRVEEFCNSLANNYNFRKLIDEPYRSSLIETFARFAKIFNFSLRVMIQCISQINIILRTTTTRRYIEYLAFLIAFRSQNPELYDNFNNRTVNYQDVINYLKEFYEAKILLFKDLVASKIILNGLLIAFKEHDEIERLYESFKGDIQKEIINDTLDINSKHSDSYTGKQESEVACYQNAIKFYYEINKTYGRFDYHRKWIQKIDYVEPFDVFVKD